MRAKITVALGFVLLAAVVWIATRKKKPAPIPNEPAIISSLVTASAASIAPPAEDLPKYTGGFCEAMERTSHLAITKASKLAGRVLEDILPTPSCIDGDRGGWALRVDDAIKTFDEYAPDQEELGFEIVLVHRDEHGALTSYPLPHDTLHPEGGPPMDVAVTRTPYWGSRSIDKLVIGDIDGDRDPEAFVTGSIHEEGPNPPWRVLVQFSAPAIRPYPGAKDIAVIDVEDVDADGRLDVLTSGAYARVEAASAIGSTYEAVGGIFVAHALPDGGLVQDDAIAKVRLKKTCPKRQPIALSPDWVQPVDAVQQIVCARAWGASEADVMKELRPRCVAYEDDFTDATHCPTALVDAAKVTPVLKLP